MVTAGGLAGKGVGVGDKGVGDNQGVGEAAIGVGDSL